MIDDADAMCRVCGCTRDDCSECCQKTGRPCRWVEEDLCSACVAVDAAHLLKMGPLTLRELAAQVGVAGLIVHSVLREFAVGEFPLFAATGGEWELAPAGYENLLEA